MTDAEYQLAQNTILQTGTLLQLVDLPTFISRAQTALAAGAVLNPTLYIRGNERLEAIKDVAVAALKYRNAVDKLREIVASDGKTAPPEAAHA